MKIKVDWERCESQGMCESLAPEYFFIDDDDNLQLLKEEVSDADRSDVEQAVASCPMSALTLVDDA